MTTTNGLIAGRPWPRLAWAAAVTACLLAVAWALQWVPLPGVSASALAGHPLLLARTSVAALGINPLLTGFVLVELFSFSPPGRRWRHGGAAGRARLNRAALAVGLVTAAVQAAGMALYLETLTNPFGIPLVYLPGFAFRVLMVVTLVAATAALFALGAAIGEWGLGNGFCWLLALGIVQDAVRAWRFGPRFQRGAEPTDVLFGALWIVPVIALVAWAELRRPAVAIEKAAGGTLAVQLPPLLQGVLPVVMGENLVDYLFALPALKAATWFSRLELLFSLGGRLLLIPAFSLIAFALFASRKRLAANLRPAAAVAPAVEKTLDRHLLGTTATLTAASIALFLVVRFVPASPALYLIPVIILTAFVLDLRDEIAFKRRHGRTARLLQLDNVHLASYLQALLREQDVDTLARAFRFRSLYYFLNPLLKIELLVPAERLETAAGLLATQELRTL